jgi:hypothetical protein
MPEPRRTLSQDFLGGSIGLLIEVGVVVALGSVAALLAVVISWVV